MRRRGDADVNAQHPTHEARELAGQLRTLAGKAAELALMLENPQNPPDVGDFRKLLRWDGKLWRITGGRQSPDGTGAITLEAES